jgi:cytochrome c peroxidase
MNQRMTPLGLIHRAAALDGTAIESSGAPFAHASRSRQFRIRRFVAELSLTIAAIATTTNLLSASSPSNKPSLQSPAKSVDFQLSARCPPSFELMEGNACQFRSLYQLYNSPPGFGGLRAALPSLPDGFSPQQIDLGRYLFFDPLLSADHHLSCAHCHRPGLGFADGHARSVGTKGVGDRTGPRRDFLLPRSAPSLWNVGFLRNFYWDGRAHSLAEQAKGPLFGSDEMNNSPRQLERDLNGQPTYRRMFTEAFQLQPSEEVTYTMVLQALSAFEATLISLNSRYDRYAHGDDDALTEAEKRGLNIFRGIELGCSQCHTPPLFTNDELEVTGVPNARGLPFDAGAGRLAASRALRGAFKTPTLRNIERTAPYMHAGQFSSLTQVVRFYDDRPGHAAPVGEHLHIDWHMALRRPVLSELDINDVVAFLLTLTDESMLPTIPLRVPSGLPVIGGARENGAVSGHSVK